MPASLENLAVATGLEKVSFHFNPREGQCQRISNYRMTALISHASKIMLKILQSSLQKYMNQELPDIWTGFRKGRGIRDQIANIHCIIEKAKDFKKTSTSTSLTTFKPLTVWIITNYGNLFRRWEYQTTLPVLGETWMRVKKQQNSIWNSWLVPNWKRSAMICYIVTLFT